MDRAKNLKNEYTCMNCGFMTTSKTDIIEHLSMNQKYDSENCVRQVLSVKKLTKKESVKK